MEAALRTAYFMVSGKNLGKVDIEAARGMEGVKVASVKIPAGGKEIEVKFAVAHGMANVRDVMDQVRAAKAAGKELPFHFIEVMACRGGCISGGGQPYGSTDEVRAKRTAGIYKDDKASAIRLSHENPSIQALYKDFLGKPLSEKSHHLLHTHYTPRPLYVK